MARVGLQRHGGGGKVLFGFIIKKKNDKNLTTGNLQESDGLSKIERHMMECKATYSVKGKTSPGVGAQIETAVESKFCE